MIRTLLSLIGVFMFLSCENKKKGESLVFQIPKLYNSQSIDTTGISKPRTHNAGEFPINGGVYRFQDTLIDMNPDSNIVYGKKRFPTPINRVSFDPNFADSLRNNGTPRLIADYKNEIIIKSTDVTKVFPVYVVNTLDKPVIFSVHSSFTSMHPFFYSEVDDIWKKYKTDGSSFKMCGCCWSKLILYPREFTIFYFPKKTKGQSYKMKIKSFDGFESTPFIGRIDTNAMFKTISSTGEMMFIDSTLYNLSYSSFAPLTNQLIP